MRTDLKKIQEKIKVKFNQLDLLQTAFIRRSYLNEHKNEKLVSNERLEFLGDSIISFWVSRNLYSLFPELPEGTLTNMRTKLVRTETLAKASEKLDLGHYLYLSHGEEKGGGRNNRALLANTFEALTGAVYLDGGLAIVEKFLEKQLKEIMIQLGAGEELKDAKSLLQEKIQTEIKVSPEYRVLEEKGPDHDKTFLIGVYNQGKLIGQGTGRSKQEAEEKAAQNALENY